MEASGVEGRKNLRLVFRDQSLLQPSPTQTSSAANAARPSQSMDIRACSTRYQKGQAKPTSGYCTGHQLPGADVTKLLRPPQLLVRERQVD